MINDDATKIGNERGGREIREHASVFLIATIEREIGVVIVVHGVAAALVVELVVVVALHLEQVRYLADELLHGARSEFAGRLRRRVEVFAARVAAVRVGDPQAEENRGVGREDLWG